MMTRASGPLKGVRVIEFAGLGPGPFAGMMLSDMGAEILRIDRKSAGKVGPERTIHARGGRSLALDLKEQNDVDLCLRLCDRAEIIFEGNRPGVMERLGLGPDILLARNPKLVYGRITGWGQSGPLARTAGHDINYLAVTGALHAIGPKEKPIVPLNLLGDYGGGSMFLVTGILAALSHARATGEGQIVDAAMTDGASYLMTLFYGMLADGLWQDRRGDNLLDGGMPFYDTYCCADGLWISIGALEPEFYATLLELTDLRERLPQAQFDPKGWNDMRQAFCKRFLSKTRKEWCDLLGGTDVCFAPVLSLSEAPQSPHNKARATFMEFDGVIQPAPAPRFSKTPSRARSNRADFDDTREHILTDWCM